MYCVTLPLFIQLTGTVAEKAQCSDIYAQAEKKKKTPTFWKLSRLLPYMRCKYLKQQKNRGTEDKL